jgi:hypothetical protein
VTAFRFGQDRFGSDSGLLSPALRDGSRHFFRAIGDADVYTPRRGFKSLVAIKNDALERVRIGKVGTSWSLPRLGKPFDAASYLVDETYKLRLGSLLETRN